MGSCARWFRTGCGKQIVVRQPQATPELPLEEAAALMAKHNIGFLPVVDRSNQLVGIITEADMFRAPTDALSVH